MVKQVSAVDETEIVVLPVRPVGSRGQRRKQEILEVALTLFSERGFEGVSLREIAVEASVDHPLIKYHFTDKDQLWREAVSHLFGRMEGEMAAFRSTNAYKDPSGSLRVLIHTLVSYHARYPEHARLMVMESVRDNDRMRWAAETYIKHQHRALVPWLEILIAAGVLPNIPRHELVTIINAMCHVTFTLAPMVQYSWGVPKPEGDDIHAHANAVLAILGLREPMLNVTTSKPS
jgi:TetR/AcrR family transcriptional regulator